MNRRLESLGGEWECIRVDKRTGKPEGNPFPAKVPGDVISDLLRNGMIKDPYLDMNSDGCRWVNDHDWLYRTSIDNGFCPPLERRFLRFHGVDYEAWFRLNGNVLGAHEGMFGRVNFEVTSSLQKENELEVLIVGRRDKRLEKVKFLNPIWRSARARMSSMKAQYSHGWDFAPGLKGGGIWDDVFMHATGPVAIEDVHVKPDVHTGEVVVEVGLSSRATGRGEIHWNARPCGADGEAVEGVERVEYTQGVQRFRFAFKVADVMPWNSWDMGEQNLYVLGVSAIFEQGHSDAIEETFGFRSVSFENNPKAPADAGPWTLVLNGRRVFMRGVNWVPMDSLLGRLDEERYRDLLGKAKEMGANVIRVWGGGLREKKVFYDICDETGLLVWQEFPFACSFIRGYPRTKRFLKLAARECGDIVRQLRNHPSLFLWCGGNELHYRRNSSLIETMARQVEAHDGSRIFHPTSPARGDAHNWIVWHGKGNLADYLQDPAPLVSEFGLQAVPAPETMEKMLSPELRWPPDKKAWEHHNIEWSKILKYARNVPHEHTLEGFAAATQKMQAEMLKTAIERWRRHKFVKGGFVVWQLNDPWPAISWSIIDYFGRPKHAWSALQMAMAPLAVVLFYPLGWWHRGEILPYDIGVINDYHRPFHGLSAKIYAGDELVDEARFDVKPNSVAVVELRKLKLDFEPPFILKVLLHDAQGNELAGNVHDLDVFDSKRASVFTRVFFNSVWQWMMKPPKEKF